MVSLPTDGVPAEGLGKLKIDVAVEPKEVGALKENGNGEAGFVTSFNSANPSELGFDSTWNIECALFVRGRDGDVDTSDLEKIIDAFDAASELVEAVGSIKAWILASSFVIRSLAVLEKGVWRVPAELGFPNEGGDFASGPPILGFPKVVESG